MKCLVLSLLFLLPSAALAQPIVPETSAGNAFNAWLDALNKADPVRMDAVIRDYHLDRTTEREMTIAHETGGLSLLRIEQSAPDALTVIVANRDNDSIERVAVALATDAIGQVVKGELHIRRIPREGEFAIPRLTQAQALRALEGRAAALAAEDKFSGAYLIAQGGKILAAKAYGWSDREARIRATRETKFRIGSMNKMFTAVAILQLIEAGKLSLDGTVGTYLPDYPNKEIASKVTIRELLTHTGGTGDFFGPLFDANRLNLKTHADYVALFGARAPLFEPGSKDDYSNYGFLVLGNIIEKVSGVSYYDYVARHVFAPAGMTNTGSLPEDQFVPGRAVAYTQKKDAWVSAADTLPYRGTSAGGGYATVGDLLKFAQALQSGKILPVRWVGDATTPHNHAGDYGYGFTVVVQGALSNYGHNGGAPGINGVLIVYPALQRVIIVLSNFDPEAAGGVADFYALRMPATP